MAPCAAERPAFKPTGNPPEGISAGSRNGRPGRPRRRLAARGAGLGVRGARKRGQRRLGGRRNRCRCRSRPRPGRVGGPFARPAFSHPAASRLISARRPGTSGRRRVPPSGVRRRWSPNRGSGPHSTSAYLRKGRWLGARLGATGSIRIDPSRVATRRRAVRIPLLTSAATVRPCASRSAGSNGKREVA